MIVPTQQSPVGAERSGPLWLRSVVFTAFMFAWTLVFAIFFVCVAWALPLPRRFDVAAGYADIMLRAARVLCRLDWRVEGLENLPDAPHVALWKHSSSWETFAQFLIGPPKVIVLKRELILIPFFGWGLWQLRSITVDRGAGASAVNQVVHKGAARLREGLPRRRVLPERDMRRIGEVSGALLASRAGCVVVPVAHDAGYFWPRRGLLKKPGTITVVIGPPIDAAGRDPREVNDEVQAWVEATIKRLRT